MFPFLYDLFVVCTFSHLFVFEVLILFVRVVLSGLLPFHIKSWNRIFHCLSFICSTRKSRIMTRVWIGTTMEGLHGLHYEFSTFLSPLQMNYSSPTSPFTLEPPFETFCSRLDTFCLVNSNDTRSTLFFLQWSGVIRYPETRLKRLSFSCFFLFQD